MSAPDEKKRKIEQDKPVSVAKATEWKKRADDGVRRAADRNDRYTYDYSVRAQEWAENEVDRAVKRESKARSSSKKYENQK
jgi:hypothetical protein